MTYDLTVSISKHILEPLTHASASNAAEAALIATLEGGRAALPLLPDVATRALELANNPATSVREFGELVMRDPPIAARFLATANSALYSRGQTIRSVTDAVARIGLGGARDLVFQVVYASNVSGLKHFQDQVQASFQRSVLCGIICRIAAPILRLDIADAYLCGLLHDIGEARVYRILSEGKPVPDAKVAAELVKKYHARAGGELMMRWALPDEMVQVCRRHEEPGVAPSERLRLVRLSDVIVDLVRAAADPAIKEQPELPRVALEELCVTTEQATTIVDRSVAAAAKL